MIRKVLRALVLVIEFLIAPAGTNFVGLAMALAIFLPLGIFIKRFGGRIEGVTEGIVNFIGGGLMFGVDWIYRHIGPHEFYAQELHLLKFDILTDSKKGGRIIYLPGWVVGILWMISGIITTAIGLIKS